MTKRSLSILVAAALAFGMFVPLPAKAQPVVPAEPNIVDPPSDANYLNEGWVRAGQGGNHTTPADASSIGDILAAWFTHTPDMISWHVQTEAPHPSSGAAYWIEVNTNPDADGVRCLSWDMVVAAPTYQADSFARIRDECAGTDSVFGEVVSEELPDGTGVVTGTVPRSAHALLAEGSTLTEPVAFMRHATGPIPGVGTLIQPTIDTTDVGTDYTIGGGGQASEPEEPKEEPPGKSDPPGKGKKKGCKKGKGKKKGACPGKPKSPPAPVCAAYVPGEEGADAETTIVTEAATEEKPVVVELEASAGGPAFGPVDETSHVYQNVQVDSAAPEAGLWVRIEFTNGHDYDLNLNHPDGTRAANSGESQPVAGLGSGSEGGYEGGSNYEMITGMRTADCDGFTTDIVSYLTTGGPVTLSYWLGEVKFDGAPPGDGAALETFYGFLGVTR